MDHQLADNILEVIKELFNKEKLHLDSDLRQATVSERLGISKQELSLAINQQTGDSFNELVNQFRLNEAKRLLENKELAIQDVCEGSGFKSRATFNRIFKEKEGVTPSEFRNRMEQ
nr:AraC family transcriptional regulator [Pleionea sp. CnH1-48]